MRRSSIFQVVLRMPYLFVIDEALNYMYSPDCMLTAAICVISLLCAAYAFTLKPRILCKVNLYILSVGLIALSQWFHQSATHTPIETIAHCLIQVMIGLLFSFCHQATRYQFVQCTIFSHFLCPLLVTTARLQIIAKYLGLIVPCGLSLAGPYWAYRHIAATLRYLSQLSWADVFASLDGHWLRFNVKTVLCSFCIVRMLTMLARSLPLTVAINPELSLVQTLVLASCENQAALAAMSSAIWLSSEGIGKRIERFLGCSTNQWSADMAPNITLLFTMHAINTFLRDLDTEQLLSQLYWDYSSIGLYFLLRVIDLVVLRLAALNMGRNGILNRTQLIKSFVVGLFAAFASMALVEVVRSNGVPACWSVTVCIISLRISFKFLISLIAFALVRWNLMGDRTENLVYYLRCVGNVVDMAFTIFILAKDVWFVSLESGGPMCSSKMAFETYEHIVVKGVPAFFAIAGLYNEWQKIRQLPDASDQQLLDNDNVCPICVDEMLKAKRTKCGHYFHVECLRRCLRLSSKCPYCRQPIDG